MRRPGSRRAALISVLLLFAVIFAAAYYSYTTGTQIFQPASSTSTKPIAIQIKPDETTAEIGDELQAKGLIRNALAFRIWARIKGLDTKIQAGTYNKLTPSMPIDKIVDELLNAQPDQLYVIIPEGYRLEQIAHKFANAGLPHFKVDDFLKYTKHADLFPDHTKYPILQDLPAGTTSMEGLLFPAGYDIALDADANAVIGTMLTQMQTVIQQNKLDALAKQHQFDNVYSMLKLASIVEREARSDEERPNIASVYWNRIYKANAETVSLLNSDPTVQYGRDNLNPPATYWLPLAAGGKDVVPNSVYNTYIKTGFPPTPICSPGLKSLLAAAGPPNTNYYFFFARKSDNKAVFAKTHQEFQDLQTQYGVSGQ